MNIYLIGYRGTGKSTVGKLLAENLDWNWIDSDEEIESRAAKTIAEIFSADGESQFRDLESAVIASIAGLDKHVVSLGGGAILRQENRDQIARSGKAVWLTADSNTIAARLAADEQTDSLRPQLTDKGVLEEIETLLVQRHDFYADTADIEFDAATLSPADLAQKISEWANQQSD